MTSWPNYINEAKVWLPMTMETHDAGNLRTLDKSGNGLHFQFGDGATSTTYPTKLASRGYSFDGTTDYLEALENQTNAITEGTWAVFYRSNPLTHGVNLQDIYSHFDGSGNARAIVYFITTEMRFYCGDVTNFAALNISCIPRGQNSLIVGRLTSDGYRRLWINGINSAPNNTGITTPSISVTTKPRIGARYSNTVYAGGRIYWYGHWEYALTELQMRDLEARLRRQFNDV